MTEHELERIFAQYADAVYRVCYTYLCNAEDSEDAVQEVFLKLIKKQPSFSSENDRKGWLIVTACNHCKSKIRWKKRHPTADIEKTGERGENDDSEAEVLELISSLPEDCRQVVYMHICEGYTLADIARLCKRNESTVRSQMFYARRKLKNMIGGSDDE